MKVALISNYTNSTPPLAYGSESFQWGLADTLGKMGHEVHLFATEGSKTPTGGFLHLIPHTEKGTINYAVEVQIEQQYHDLLMGMDIVHDFSLDHIVAERLRYLYGKQEIINSINGRCYNMPRPPFNVVTGSKAWQEDARKFGRETEMVYYGIDTNFYVPGGEGKDYCLWISRFHPDKGLDLALDLAEILGFPFKVAGSMQFADHEEYGRKYLERISNIPNVEYVQLPLDITHHEKKRELYQEAKAFLYPVQYFECFGMVVAEALACGCPVITTPNGAMPELVLNGRTGFICNTKQDFAKVLQKTLPGYHSTSSLHGGFDLWTKAREHALNFSWQKAAIEYERLYLEVKAGKSW